MTWRIGDTGRTVVAVSASRIRRALRRALARALQHSRRKSQVYLELFCGTGGVSAALEQRDGYGVVRLDLNSDPCFDLTNPVVTGVIIGWITSRVVRGIFAAPPCSTWSAASGGTYRTSTHIYGRLDLPAHLAERVAAGNAALAQTLRILRACLAHCVPFFMENPLGSLMWQQPVLAHLLQDRRAKTTAVDYCQHGTRWRKSTRFAGWTCAAPPSGLALRCSGRHGVCSRTHIGHIALRGSAPGGKAWTAIAEPYPRSICTAVAAWVSASASALEHARFSSFLANAS